MPITTFVGPYGSGCTTALESLIDDNTLIIANTSRQRDRATFRHATTEAKTLTEIVHVATVAQHCERTDTVWASGLISRLTHSSVMPSASRAQFTQLLHNANVAVPGAIDTLLDFVGRNAPAVNRVLDELHATSPELDTKLFLADPEWTALPTPGRIVVDDLQNYRPEEVELLIGWAKHISADLAVALHPEATLHDFRGADPQATLALLERAGAQTTVMSNPGLAKVSTSAVTAQSDVTAFVRAARAMGRSVAVLGTTRRIAEDQAARLKQDLPEMSVHLGITGRTHEITLVHDEILKHWDEIQQVSPSSALTHIDSLFKVDGRAKKRPQWNAILDVVRPKVADLVARLGNDELDTATFFENLREVLVRVEAEVNTQRFATARAQARSNVIADVQVSTVHAAIGRRFDSIVMVSDSSPRWKDVATYGMARANVEVVQLTRDVGRLGPQRTCG